MSAWRRAGVAALAIVTGWASFATGEFVLVTEWGANGGAGVAKIDPATDLITDRVANSGSPRHMTVDATRRIAYVSLHDSDAVAAILPDTLEMADLVIPGLGKAPIGVSLTPDGNTLLVATSGDDGVISGDDRLDVVSLNHASWPPSCTLITSIATGLQPIQAIVDHTGRYAVVTVRNQPAILGVDLSTNQVVWQAASLPAGAEPEGGDAHPTQDVIYVTLHGKNTIEVIGLNPFRTIRHVPITNPGGGSPQPSTIAFTPDGSRAYVSAQTVNRVLMFDTTDPSNPVQDLSVAVSVGPQPHHIVWLPGDRAYVANTNNMQTYGSLSVLHDCSATPSVTGPILSDLAGPLSFGYFEALATPVLSALSCAYGSEGETITLTGGPFGIYQGTSTVTVNGVIAPVALWGDAAVSVVLPAGVTSGDIVLWARGQPSNSLPFEAAPAPLSEVPNLRASRASGEIQFTWDPQELTICGTVSAAAFYRIYRAATPSSAFSCLGTSATAGFLTTTGDGATPSAWFYQVRAVDNLGREGL